MNNRFKAGSRKIEAKRPKFAKKIKASPICNVVFKGEGADKNKSRVLDTFRRGNKRAELCNERLQKESLPRVCLSLFNLLKKKFGIL